MREIRLLAVKHRISEGDLLWLAREAAGDASLSSIAALSANQIAKLRAVLQIITSPVDVEDYERLPLAS